MKSQALNFKVAERLEYPFKMGARKVLNCANDMT